MDGRGVTAMAAPDEPTFLHLDRDGLWPDFRWTGLEREADGTLHLVTLPVLVEGAVSDLDAVPTPSAPGGITVADDGRVFWSDPAAGRVLFRDPCDGTVGPLPCLGEGGPFRVPGGLAIHPRRRELMVADAGAASVWILSADARTVAERWPIPGATAGEPSGPAALAVLDDHVYVLDAVNARLEKLDPWGRRVEEFAAAVDARGVLVKPTAIATAAGRIFVLDAAERAVLVFDEAGSLVRTFPLAGVRAPMGIAVGDRAVFVGDNAARALVQFGREGGEVGSAIGYRGPVAALALAAGNLWVSPGQGRPPLLLAARGGFVRKGVLWGGPFGFADTAHLWGRLSARGMPLAEGAHFRLLVHLADRTEQPPPVPGTELAPWQAGPPDVADLYIGRESIFLWVAAIFEGDGLASPRVAQIRVDADHDTYSRYLPPLYVRDPEEKKILDAFLALFESQYVDVERAIAELPRLFDPATAPPLWLDGLAGWLAVPLDEAWSEAKKRRAIARAFESHCWRGTARGLEDALEFELGVRAVVEEPIVHREWWALARADAASTAWDDTSVLGLTTMLTTGAPEGAVLGTTATLDHSRIITDAEFGAPLFDEVAHRFRVQLYHPAADDPRVLEQAHAVIEREKPAHTIYQVCPVEPAMRVGYQSIVGVDTVVGGGPPPPTRLGEEITARGVVLSGHPPARLGSDAAIGTTSHLGDGIVGAG